MNGRRKTASSITACIIANTPWIGAYYLRWQANGSVLTLLDVAPAARPKAHPGAFVLNRKGRTIARTGSHGQFVAWL